MMWEIITLTTIFFGVLGSAAFRVRVGSAFHRGMKKCVYAVWALFLFSLLPGVQLGVNALNIALTAALGAPGIALTQIIALMP